MGRYDELGQFLIQHGILVFGHDQGESIVYSLMKEDL